MGKIDLSYLEDITSGESEIMIEMIDLMLEETPKHFENLNKSLHQKDWKGVGSEAHKIKPLLLYVGLTGLNAIAQKLETYGRNEENLEVIPKLIEDLQTGFDEVKDELKEKKEELG